MANINIIGRPFTAELNYFNAGVQDVSTQRQNIFTTPYSVAANLDSIQSQLVWNLNSEVLGTSVKSEIKLDLTTNPTIIQIQIFNEILTESTTSNLEYNQFYNNTFSIADRINSIVNIINSNINLNWKYIAFNDSNLYVHIVAKNSGTIFNLSGTNFSTDCPTVGYVSGVDGSRGEKLQNYNYKCFIEIWEVENVDWNRVGSVTQLSSNTRNKITTLTQNWNTENIFSFDISNFFNVEEPMIGEEVTGTAITPYNFNIVYKPKCYYLRYGESFIGGYDPSTNLPVDSDSWNITNTNETKRYIGDSELRWISNGVFLQSLLANDYPTYWLNSEYDNSTTNKYLDIKIVQEFSTKLKRREYNPEYISVWIYNDQQYSNQFSLRLKTDWTFIDGSTVTTYNFDTPNLQNNGLYTIDASLTNIFLDNVESSNNNRVLYYTNTIEINRGIGYLSLSKPFNYKIDMNDERDKLRRKIYWINKYGALEQFEFEGFSEESVNTNFNSYTKSLLNTNFIERNRHIKGVIAKVPTKRYKVNSGWLSKSEIESLQSIILSNRCWWIEDFTLSVYFGELITSTSESFEAINVIEQDFKVDNKNRLFNLEVTIEVAQNDNLQK
jgi:hypothetical protein